MKTEPYVEAAEGPDGEPILALVAGGAYQSATYLGKRRFEPVFAYHRAFDCMFQAGIDVRDVLMLGGGGYSYPKHFAIAHPRLPHGRGGGRSGRHVPGEGAVLLAGSARWA